MDNLMYSVASEDDIVFINETYNENIDRLHGVQRNVDVWKELMSCKDSTYYVVNAETPVAWFRIDVEDDELWIGMLQVKPMYQHKGIGKYVLSAAENIAREKGYKRIGIHTTKDNIIARALYLSAGYTVTEIGESAFWGCSSLTNINIPSSVTSIGNYAFSGCVGLSDIEIPSSVSSIGYFAFSGCDNFEPRLFTYYNGTKCYGWVGITEKCVTVEIPSSVTSIGINAFYNCKNMTSINIPSNVTDIGDQAFSYCSSLTSINIPSSVQFIGSYAFLRCTNLDVTIDNSKENIRSGMMVFNDCKSVTWLKE